MDYNKLNTRCFYINGQYVDPKNKEFIDVENPATEEIIGQIPKAGKEDINNAIDSAYLAFPSWANTSLEERKSYIIKLAAWIKDHSDKFDRVILEELGIPIHIGHNSQVLRQIKRIETFVEQISKINTKEEVPGGLLTRQPYGVVASITPWNYPLGQIIQKVIPALLSGCTVVQKPATNTPMTAYLFTKAIDEIGFPKGVFNLITGQGAEIGDILTSHPKVAMVSYTGSLKGGSQAGANAMKDAKKVVLELGGKSPAIFLKGANIEKSVKRVLDSVYTNVGQTCSCLSRAIVTEDIYEDVLQEFLKQYDNYPLGDPREKSTVVGTLSSRKQFDRVKYYIEKGLEEGCELIRGEIPEKREKGYYVKPAIFTNVKAGMTIHDEEIFGPVLSIIKVKDKDEAIYVANSVDYGLSSAVFGDEIEAIEVAEKIQAGDTYVNAGGKNGENMPFGGYKQSGLGREGGIFGLLEYYQLKAIYK